MSNDKWWQDNDRYIPNPWDEITRLQNELNQMQITESALRESLTGLSRESNEYRHKIETENAALREQAEFGADMLLKAAEYKQRAEQAEAENAALRELSARMADEMREIDHEFASLRDYEQASKEVKP